VATPVLNLEATAAFVIGDVNPLPVV